MARFSGNTKHFNPYQDFKFRVKWDGRYVAGVSKVSALKQTAYPIEYRQGGDPNTVRKAPGQAKYEPVTLERGVTYDPDFDKWTNNILGDLVRNDITIEVYNEAGQLVVAYNIYRCWVSEYQGIPESNLTVKAVAINTLKLENEGWERIIP